MSNYSLASPGLVRTFGLDTFSYGSSPDLRDWLEQTLQRQRELRFAQMQKERLKDPRVQKSLAALDRMRKLERAMFEEQRRRASLKNRRPYRRESDVRNWRYQRSPIESALMSDTTSDSLGLARGWRDLRRGALKTSGEPTSPSLSPDELLRRRIRWLTGEEPPVSNAVRLRFPADYNRLAASLGLGYGDEASRKYGAYRDKRILPVTRTKVEVRHDALGRPHIALIGTMDPELAAQSRQESLANARKARDVRKKRRELALRSLLLGEAGGAGFSTEGLDPKSAMIATKALRRGIRNRREAMARQQMAQAANFDRLVRTMIAAAPYVGKEGDTASGFRALSEFILGSRQVGRPDYGPMSNLYNAQMAYLTEKMKLEQAKELNRRNSLISMYQAALQAGDMETAAKIFAELQAAGIVSGAVPSAATQQGRRRVEGYGNANAFGSTSGNKPTYSAEIPESVRKNMEKNRQELNPSVNKYYADPNRYGNPYNFFDLGIR